MWYPKIHGLAVAPTLLTPKPMHYRGLCNIRWCAMSISTVVPTVQYFTRQRATPGNVPLVLAGIKKAYPVHNLLYSISRIIGPKEEPSGLMWLVEGDWNHVACHFLRLSATQHSKHPISCGFAVITMCMYATYMCDKFSVIVWSPDLRQWVTLIKFEGQSVNCRDPHTQWPHPSKRPQ